MQNLRQQIFLPIILVLCGCAASTGMDPAEKAFIDELRQLNDTEGCSAVLAKLALDARYPDRPWRRNMHQGATYDCGTTEDKFAIRLEEATSIVGYISGYSYGQLSAVQQKVSDAWQLLPSLPADRKRNAYVEMQDFFVLMRDQGVIMGPAADFKALREIRYFSITDYWRLINPDANRDLGFVEYAMKSNFEKEPLDQIAAALRNAYVAKTFEHIKQCNQVQVSSNRSFIIERVNDAECPQACRVDAPPNGNVQISYKVRDAFDDDALVVAKITDVSTGMHLYIDEKDITAQGLPSFGVRRIQPVFTKLAAPVGEITQPNGEIPEAEHCGDVVQYHPSHSEFLKWYTQTDRWNSEKLKWPEWPSVPPYERLTVLD